MAVIRLIACDFDGVVYRGGIVLPGVREALDDVLARGLDLRYVSNNATAHRRVVSDRLAGMGLPAGVDRVLTSAYATGRWLRERLPAGAAVMVVGEAGLLEELREAGFEVFHAGESTVAGGSAPAGPAVAVVVALDRCFSYVALAAAQKAIMEGALFVATNRDATFPAEHRLMPGAGALVAAVSAAAEKEPVCIGKPSPELARTLEGLTGVPASETLLVGDRVSTDIAMGHAAGMRTALVLTGVASATDARNSLADHVMGGLGELPSLLDQLGAEKG